MAAASWHSGWHPYTLNELQDTQSIQKMQQSAALTWLDGAPPCACGRHAQQPLNVVLTVAVAAACGPALRRKHADIANHKQ
jgi:hypothetical protein